MERDNVPCITCRHNLLETGKYDSKRPGFAYCSLCQAYYQVVPITDEYGEQQYTEYGDAAFYLNPVKPGRAEFAKDLEFQVTDSTKSKPDFSKLLEKIQKANTPKDLTD